MQASTYREFSRKRYLELKESHGGRMRESEIIQKIIREWDDMKMTKKDRLAGYSPSYAAETSPLPPPSRRNNAWFPSNSKTNPNSNPPRKRRKKRARRRPG
jgi:hypothetical protein